MIKSEQVIIAGGGIAGLAAAIALAECGFKICIFEKAPILSEQGAGVQLGPNATVILRRWGLEEGLMACACQPESIELHDAITGQQLVDLPVARFVRDHWHAPYITIHRADLQSLLKQAVEKNPLICLKYGVRVQGVSGRLENGFDVEVEGQTGFEKYSCALFLACDGVWSHLRQGDKAQFSGFVAWRTTIETKYSPFLSSRNVRVFMGSNGHFIIYPVRGGQIGNLVAITNSKIAENNDKAQLIRAFSRGMIDIAHIITHAANWTYWPLFIMPNPEFLGPTGVVLLGDSAHATTPFAAQGAAMALEDAACLAAYLPNISALSRQNLADFAKIRQQRLRKVIRRGRLNRFVYHAGKPVTFARNFVMRTRAPEKFLTDLDWLYQP